LDWRIPLEYGVRANVALKFCRQYDSSAELKHAYTGCFY
jgi:hypothetical protein